MTSEVGVALIAVVGVLGSAGIAAYVQTRALGKSVGKSNGQGTVVQMLERGLRWQEGHRLQDAHNFRVLAEALHVPLDRFIGIELEEPIEPNTTADGARW